MCNFVGVTLQRKYHGLPWHNRIQGDLQGCWPWRCVRRLDGAEQRDWMLQVVQSLVAFVLEKLTTLDLTGEGRLSGLDDLVKSSS